MERQKCSECRHRIIKAPDMGGNHARGCRINHMHWREHDYRNRECFLPEPYCYAPAMLVEIERLKAELKICNDAIAWIKSMGHKGCNKRR